MTLLLGNGAKPDIGKNMGKKLIYTPLCYACITGRLDCVRALIKADCPLEAQRAEVALKLAQDNGHDDIFRELKAAGALQSKEDEDKEKEEKDKEKDKAGGKGRRDTKEEEAKGGAEKGKAQKKADASGVAAAPSAAPAEENNIDYRISGEFAIIAENVALLKKIGEAEAVVGNPTSEPIFKQV